MNAAARHGEAGRQPAEDRQVRGAPRHRRIVSSTWRRSAAVCTAVMLAALAPWPAAGPEIPRLTAAGIAQDPCHPQVALPVGPAVTGHFERDSSVLVTAHGIYVAPGEVVPLTAAESACAAADARAGQSWLSAGLVPGVTGTQRSMAARALLDLRLAVQPDGAVIAGWALWLGVRLAARLKLGRGGARRHRPCRPGLPDPALPAADAERERDLGGQVPARWFRSGPRRTAGRARRGRLGAVGRLVLGRHAAAAGRQPGTARAWLAVADGQQRRRRRRALADRRWPARPAMDYWEDSVQVTLGTAAPLLAGLRAAAGLSADIGGASALRDGRRWAAAAASLTAAIRARFGRNGFQRTPAAGSGADAAVTFLGPPFAAPDPAVRLAARSAQRTLAVTGSGGLRPGVSWHGTPGVSWTTETALFALFDAATGQHAQAARLLSWLAAHRTRLGSLPEQVSASGEPASVAPLAWADAVTLLTLLAQSRTLATVPAP